MEAFPIPEKKDKKENSLSNKAKLLTLAALTFSAGQEGHAQHAKEHEPSHEKTVSDKTKKPKNNDKTIEYQPLSQYDRAFENIIETKTSKEKKQIALAMGNALFEHEQEKLAPLLRRINYYGQDDYSDANRKIRQDYPDVKLAPGILKEEADSGRAHYSHNTVHFPTMLKNKIPTSKDTFETLTAEIPHHIQEKKYGRLRSNVKSVTGLLRYGDEKRYEVPGTHEYEAHTVIEPELIKKYSPDTTTTENERNELVAFEKLEYQLHEIKIGYFNEEELNQYICDLSLNPYFKNRSETFLINGIEIPPFKK